MLIFDSRRLLSPLFHCSHCINFSISNKEVTYPKLLLQSRRKMVIKCGGFFSPKVAISHLTHTKSNIPVLTLAMCSVCSIDSVTSLTKDKYKTLKH